MKILHIDTEKTWRGGEQQLLYLVKGLKERGHTSTVVCQPGSPLEDAVINAGIEVVPVRMRGEFDLPAAWQIGRLLRKGNYDILHTHTSHAHSIGLLSRLFGKVSGMAVSKRTIFPIRNSFKYKFFNVHYIAISETIRNVMREAGIPAEKIDVVFSCIDLGRFDKLGIKDIKKELGVKDGSIIVGNIAHMSAEKGHIDLIKAASIVKDKYSNTKFVIVGDGELRGELEAEAKKLGLNETVIFTGFRKDIASLLSSFDIFAFPSHLEGLGTSLLDAMVMRKPIVSTTAGGIPEVVQDGVNGILVPPKEPEALAEAIIMFIEDPGLRLKYSNAGRRIVEDNFTVDRVVDGTLAVYKRMLGKR